MKKSLGCVGMSNVVNDKIRNGFGCSKITRLFRLPYLIGELVLFLSSLISEYNAKIENCDKYK